MRIPSGKTDQSIYFVAVLASDLKTRATGLTGFTVYRSRNNGAATAYTTPTITEVSSANFPGVYTLLVDEDTTIGASSDSEEYCLHISVATMEPITRVIELYRRDTTSGRTLAVDASSRALSDVDTIKTNPVVNGGTITFPTAATLASTTNITAGTLTTVTTATNLGSNALNSSALATSAVTEIVDGVWNGVLSSYVTAGTAGKVLSDDSTSIAAILVDTAEIGAAGAGLTALASAANLATLDDFVDTEIADIQSRLPAALVSGRMDSSVGAMAVNVITAAATAADFGAEIADAICDEALSGHTTAGTLGKALLDVSGMVTSSGTAQAGTASTITLAAGASASNIFDPGYIILTGGTGAGQGRPIVGYNTTTKVCTIMQDFKVVPDNTTTYITVAGGERMHTNDGTAQAGGVNTITLNSTAASGTDTLKGQLVWICGGTGQDQVGIITAYDGTTKIATMGRDWVVTPDSTSIYILYPVGPAMVLDYENTLLAPLTTSQTESAVWNATAASYVAVGSTGEALSAAGAGGSDAWLTALPGAYGAGTAGYILGTNLNATVSSRASQTSVDDLPTNAELATALGTADDAVLTAIDALPTNAELATALAAADDAVLAAVAAVDTKIDTIDTVVDAIKAKTDSLTFTVAGVVDANIQRINDVVITGDGQSGTEFGV